MGCVKEPERIWAVFLEHEAGGLPRVHASCSKTKGTEYVRKERDAQAEIARLRKVLNNIYENVEYWNTLQISSKIRAALHRKEGDE